MQRRLFAVGPPLDNTACGAVEIGGFIDDDGRIARAGDDRPLLLLHRRLAHSRTAGDANQIDIRMLEQGVGALDGRLGDDAQQVVDAQIPVDRFVVASHALAATRRPLGCG